MAQSVDAAREAALRVLCRVEREKAYGNLLLNGVLERGAWSPLDRSFMTELVYGVLRHRGRLDWILEHVASRPLSEMPLRIRNILRLGLYQMFFLKKVPDSAAVNESVKLAKKYGHPGTTKLVNAVLRHTALDDVERRLQELDTTSPEGLAIEYSHPEWMIRKWLDERGLEQTREICRANNAIPPLTIRVNTLKADADTLAHRLSEEDTETRPNGIAGDCLDIIDLGRPLRKLKAFSEGLFHVQDASSTLACYALNPQAGETVLDLCAGPGGKTVLLAQLMNNRGSIHAVDVHAHRLKLVKDNCRRLGVKIAHVLEADGTRMADQDVPAVDRAMVDVPCSGLGVIRRRLDLKWRITENQIAPLTDLQLRLLLGASEKIKEGGVMVYTTCTISKSENEQVIERFLGEKADFDLVGAFDTPVPVLGLDTPCQILPGQGNMDGFFIAKLVRAR